MYVSLLLAGTLVDRQTVATPCLTVLVDDAMDAPVLHGLAVVDVLGGKFAVADEQYPKAQENDAYSNY